MPDPASISGDPAIGFGYRQPPGGGWHPAGATGTTADLCTARLRLRAPTQADLPDFHRLHNDPACHPYDAWARHPDLKHSQTVLAAALADWSRDALGYWIVRDRLSEVLIGVCGVRASGFTDRTGSWRTTGTWNAYYRLAPTAWGHGYAGEAIRAAVRCCAVIDPTAVIEARVAVGNVPSARLARALGLRLLHTEDEPNGVQVNCYQGDAVELASSALGDHR